MYAVKKLDIAKKSGGANREQEYYEYWHDQGVKLKLKYRPEGHYAKSAHPGGGK